MVRQRLGNAWRRWRRPERLRLAAKMKRGRATGEAIELDRAEFRVMFDRVTRRELHMSADEFLTRMREGKLPDSEMAEYLAQMAGAGIR